MTTPPVVLVSGRVFAVTTRSGDITAPTSADPGAGDTDGPLGFFVDDARLLSRWEMTVDGRSAHTLSAEDFGCGRRITLMPPAERDQPPPYAIFREQVVDAAGLTESLRLTSYRGLATVVRVQYAVAADFADQFELRSRSTRFEKPGARRSWEPRRGGAEFRYRRGDFEAGGVLTAEPAPTVDPIREGSASEGDASDGCVLRWELVLPPYETVEIQLSLVPLPWPCRVPAVRSASAAAKSAREADLDFLRPAIGNLWPAGPPEPSARTESDRACCQGLRDLALLRLDPPGRPDLVVPGAGVPWFLTLFGRDSLITSYAALPYLPDLAAGTLRALAASQGTVVDDRRAEEPGKIVHEVRLGELSRFDQVPYGRYYGSVDATPLFLVVLSEYVRVTGDRALSRELESAARAAIGWMVDYGGLGDDRGYLRYSSDGRHGGLVQQCWKDSPTSMCFRDGTVATGPIAVSEAQGYAYDALVRTAEIASRDWDDPSYAQNLRKRASELKTRFQTDFWLRDEDFVAVALDGSGGRVNALTSNLGHLLWSGILDQERGVQLGCRLVEPDLFSGWGIRTVATGQGAYHPLSYHRGSVWPHDTGLAVAGLAKYGLRESARMVADGLLAAAAATDYRLPEVFAGFSRDEHPNPVPFPHSCSPQAWAAATPLLLRTVLGST